MKSNKTISKAIILACFFILIAIVVNAQSGPKWSVGLNSCSGNDAFGTSNNFWIVFMTNNTAHMWLTPAGNLGLGISNPTYKFDVNGRVHTSGNILSDSNITAMNLYAVQKVTADALQVNNNSQLKGIAVFGNNIIIDGANSSISSSADALNFGSNNLQTSGNITGNIFTANAVKVSGLGGSGTTLVTVDNTGNLTPFSFSGNTNEVLSGNGAWKILPQQSPWIADSIGIYPDSTLSNTNVFVKSLYASNSVSIGTFRFKNGLPSERDSISAEKRITIYAPSKIELNADTLTMKNRVGIGVAAPQSALDVAGDINSSGTVYANNLYAQNSIAIGTLKICNGGELPPGDIRDSISSPYKLALVSAGREISLISDTVKIGDYNSTVRFDVNGSVRVRDLLWVEDGMIIGREFEGSSARIDSVASKNIAATNVAAENVSAERLNADSLTSAISMSDTAFTQRLVVDGNAKVKGDATITGNLKVLGSLTGVAGFDSLHVYNKIKIGHSIFIEGYDPLGGPGGPDNKIYTNDYNVNGNNDLLIQCGQSYISGSHNTIINANNLSKVGIGTNLPNYKLHLHSDEMTDPGDPAYATLPQIPNVDDEGNDIVPSQTISENNTIPFPPPPIGFTTFQITNTTTGVTLNDGFKIMQTGTSSYLNAASGNMILSTPYASSFAVSSGGINLSAHSSNIFMQANRYNFRVNNFGMAMTITQNGNVGIGTTSPVQKLHVVGNSYFDGQVGIGTDDPHNTLDVCGTIRAKEIIVDETAWCDYVFNKDYKRMTFEEKEKFYLNNQHLPGIASGKEIETNGLKTGETMKGMILNIEENSLDIIDLYKMILELNKEIELLNKEIENLKK